MSDECVHKYPSDGGSCIFCGKQGGLYKMKDEKIENKMEDPNIENKAAPDTAFGARKFIIGDRTVNKMINIVSDIDNGMTNLKDAVELLKEMQETPYHETEEVQESDK